MVIFVLFCLCVGEWKRAEACSPGAERPGRDGAGGGEGMASEF